MSKENRLSVLLKILARLSEMHDTSTHEPFWKEVEEFQKKYRFLVMKEERERAKEIIEFKLKDLLDKL